MDKPVIIIGAGGLGKATLDIFKSNQVIVYGFLDSDENLYGTKIQDVTVLGGFKDDIFLKLIGPKCEAFLALDDPQSRKELGHVILEDRKVMPVNAIHRSAFIEESVRISHGSFINSGVIIGSGAVLGSFCLFHSGVIIDYQVSIGDYAQIGAGSVLNSNAQIGKSVLIGSGATIAAGVKIGDKAQIAPGSVVIGEVKKGQTVFGNPAQPV